MEEKKKRKPLISSYTLISLTIIGIICFVGYKSYNRIKAEHEEKVLHVITEKIKYNAKRCYLENKCKENMTLSDLYKYGYIKTEIFNEVTDDVVDPATKIYIVNNEAMVELD